uniref:Uncharacterized protein n=1 Tax=Cacopsylla melanoneura TaxID=428564 RepID=A0A8D8ZDL4_9HEMI
MSNSRSDSRDNRSGRGREKADESAFRRNRYCRRCMHGGRRGRDIHRNRVTGLVVRRRTTTTGTRWVQQHLHSLKRLIGFIQLPNLHIEISYSLLLILNFINQGEHKHRIIFSPNTCIFCTFHFQSSTGPTLIGFCLRDRCSGGYR